MNGTGHVHAGGESDYQALVETRAAVKRWRFHCLVKRLCRTRGPLAWWRVHTAWQRVRRRPDKSRALWLEAS